MIDMGKKTSNLFKLNNEHVNSLNKEARREERRRVGRNRRIAVVFVGCLIFFSILGNFLHKQNERLEAKQQVLEQRQEELAVAEEKQEQLKLQIAKLDDDEYIAKLARKEYFLSEEGEIIFTIPEDDDKDSDKKEDQHKADKEKKKDKE